MISLKYEILLQILQCICQQRGESHTLVPKAFHALSLIASSPLPHYIHPALALTLYFSPTKLLKLLEHSLLLIIYFFMIHSLSHEK